MGLLDNDDFDKRVNEQFNQVKWIGILSFIVTAALGLGFLGLIVWAVVKLVTHFAG